MKFIFSFLETFIVCNKILTGAPNKMNPFWQVYVARDPALCPLTDTVAPDTGGGSGHQSNRHFGGSSVHIPSSPQFLSASPTRVWFSLHVYNTLAPCVVLPSVRVTSPSCIGVMFPQFTSVVTKKTNLEFILAKYISHWKTLLKSSKGSKCR